MVVIKTFKGIKKITVVEEYQHYTSNIKYTVWLQFLPLHKF